MPGQAVKVGVVLVFPPGTNPTLIDTGVDTNPTARIARITTLLGLTGCDAVSTKKSTFTSNGATFPGDTGEEFAIPK